MLTALITGINGQDGSYLAELLLEKGYKVHGVLRRSSTDTTSRLKHIMNKINLHYGDVTDKISILELISDIKPDEIYNLAAMSDVKVSFTLSDYTINVNTLGLMNILDAVRFCKLDKCKIYQAGTSEMFGSTPSPQNESSSMNPCSLYGLSKMFAFYLAKHYREVYKMYVVNGILFNHESPRRGDMFVTKKITNCAKQKIPVQLGNINSKRDWGHTKDFVRAMWMMMQLDQPDDYVVCTGEQYTVEEFAKRAYANMGLDYKNMITHNENLLRPNDVEDLRGDNTKFYKATGWKPNITFDELIDDMMNN